jgi:hypothetical protein
MCFSSFLNQGKKQMQFVFDEFPFSWKMYYVVLIFFHKIAVNSKRRKYKENHCCLGG